MDYIESIGPIILFIITIYTLFYRKPYLYVYFITFFVLFNREQSLGFSNAFLLLSNVHTYWLILSISITILTIRNYTMESVGHFIVGIIFANLVFYATTYYLETLTNNKDEFIYM